MASLARRHFWGGRGLALLCALVGTGVAFLLISMDAHWELGVHLGLFACLVATVGWVSWAGSFGALPPTSDQKVEGARLLAPFVEWSSSGLAFFIAMRMAVAGNLPWPVVTASILVTGTFLWCVVTTWRIGRVIGLFASGGERLAQRHGFWLVLITTLLYLPRLGSYSLSDPWETHYGEVAREILAREDWISLWWAQDGWFWSKPILDFWTQSLSFAVFGVRYLPDQMIAAFGQGAFPMPEWAARLPVFLMTLAGDYLLYKGVSKAFGRLVGLVSGLILATTPYWFFLAHQTMTDMPYVAPLAGALGLFLWALETDFDEKVRVFAIRLGPWWLRFSIPQLLLGLVVVAALPQVLYLISRNITFLVDGAPAFHFRFHEDVFYAGSGPTTGRGNCGLPGNSGCSMAVSFYRSVALQPAILGLVWAAAGGLLLAFWSKERGARRLAFMGAWICVALSAMGKGAPGLVIPWVALLAYLVATRRWRDLLDLEWASAALILVAVALPWYVQSVVRHGPPFVDRLFFHDMYKRAFVHVHDTNTGVDVSFRYYIWQLGYGLFPWSGASLAGLLWWVRLREDRGPGKAMALPVLWLISSFGMFTVSLTKFHHYILPVVPAVAALAGYWVVKALDPSTLPQGRRLALRVGSTLLGAALLVCGASQGSLWGSPQRAQLAPYWSVLLIIAGGALCFGAGRLQAIVASAAASESSDDALGTPEGSEPGWLNHQSIMVGVLGLIGALVIVLVGRDLVITAPGDVEGQVRLLQLFTYNYTRSWPQSLDFQSPLVAFTLVAAGASALLVIRRWRNQATLTLLAVSVLWAAWALDIYLVLISPHWGQRETVAEYYRRRRGTEEPLIAYQMNWKGENFYTGNRLPAFVSDSKGFKDYLDEQRRQSHKVVFVTTEHGRVSNLQSELGKTRKFEYVTTKDLNNKFVLVRVELD